MCQKLNSNTMAGQHVLSHVWDYVERRVELIDGIPYSKPYWVSRNRLDSHYGDKFYVHPETGILCASAKTPRKQKQNQPQRDRVILGEYHRYYQINGIWYLITFEEFPPSPTEWVTDVLEGTISRSAARWINDCKVYAAKKQQCSKKEIRFILNQFPKL